MRRNQILIVSTFFFLIQESGQARLLHGQGENEYDVKNIPPSLLKDADAVVRKNIVQFEVKNRKRSKKIVKRAVTIFKKEERQQYGSIFLTYDKFSEIDDLEGKIFDARGEEIRELESKNIKDYSIVSGYAFFADNKAKSAELYHNEYPYTVEFTYEISYKGSLQWPSWVSQFSLDPIEQSRFEVIVPDKDSLRFWCSNDTVKPTIIMDGGDRIYIWESRNLPKLSKDVVGEDMEDKATVVRIAPRCFEMGDYPGDMSTWKDFGKWNYSLIKGRDKLPEPALNDIHSLLQPNDNKQTKIKKLYQYMQNRTRYVSIQLGIGGWQPFDATFVHENGYGDCKALSNYMVALLKEAGITGYSVLIRPGDLRYPFIEEFPSIQFTHVIVCIPLEKDSVWLECTSQSMPHGHLSDFNENRGALMITPEGGVVVYTPRSTSKENVQERHATVTFGSHGSAEVNSVVRRKGNQQDYVRAGLYDASPQDRERWILNSLGVQNVNLKSYNVEGLLDRNIEVLLSLQLSLLRFVSTSGDRIFFMPNLMERQTYIPPDTEKRLSPIRYKYPYIDTDTIYYSLPDDYTIESIPSETHLEASFGSYKSETKALGDSVIIYTRIKEIREYSIPAEKYSEYRKFHSDMVKADKVQVVLVKKNQW